MRRQRHPGEKRVGLLIVGIGAAMIVALMLPFWFWWLVIGIGFLCGGIWLLKR